MKAAPSAIRRPRDKRDNQLFGLLFTLPFILGFVFIFLYIFITAIRFSVYGLVGILLTYGGKKDLDQERLIQWMETLLTAIFQSMEKKNGA